MFQFTHPGRGATERLYDVQLAVEVSIHAPREGCDTTKADTYTSRRSFNSRTPGGVRLPSSVDLLTPLRVSIHAPREGCDACYPRRFLRLIRFQFTHPGRGATNVVRPKLLISLRFQFTHPGRGATQPPRTAPRLREGFNSRTPGGVRRV